jgi:hypothetical protein
MVSRRRRRRRRRVFARERGGLSTREREIIDKQREKEREKTHTDIQREKRRERY